jgi:predicted nuclease of predicted toxin-antitoxin system
MVGLRSANEDAIWQYAMGNGLAVITKCEDFVLRRLLEPSGPQIVWLRIGNCSNRELLTRFLPVLPEVVSRLKGPEIVVEVI